MLCAGYGSSGRQEELDADSAAGLERLKQKDKEIDKWLACAASADEWFFKADSIGEIASLEADARAKKAGR